MILRTSRSLWRELADGSAGWGVRAVVTVALGGLIGGVSSISVYVLAGLVPTWGDAWGQGMGVRPHEELAAGVLIAGGVVFLLAGAWVWRRAPQLPGFRLRSLRAPTALTVGIALVTSLACGILDAALDGDDEWVFAGVILVAFAAAVLVWLCAWDAHLRRRELSNAEDGLPDIRCPMCGYRMVGLNASRCPECGAQYTLDQLLAAQDFARPGPRPVPPPPGPPPGLPAGPCAEELRQRAS